jgi:hypothetical protein
MQRSKRLPTLIAILATTCSLAGTRVDYDRTVDFSTYHTYSWQDGTLAMHERVQETIEQAIDGQLGAKGLARQTSDGDLLIVAHASMARDTGVPADRTGGGDWPGWDDRGGSRDGPGEVSEIPAGTLIVDIVDAETRKLVWRGIASGAIKPSGEQTSKKIDKKIAKLFSRFPPTDGS